VKKYSWYIVIFILSLSFFYFQINEKYNFFIAKKDLNITLPPKISKQECNTTFIAKNNLWLKIKIKEKKKKKSTINNKKVFTNGNLIVINNSQYKYIGNYNNFLLFVTKSDKHTKFIKLKIKDKFPDSNVTLLKNTKQEIVFKYKDKNLTIKKHFIDIKKYQTKDNNESKN